jgi:hypothetical protein
MARATMTLVRVNGKVEWRAGRTKGGNWVAICDPLKLTLQAKTWADLMQDISLTLNAMLKDLLSSNELNQFMKDQGWKLVQSIPARQEDIQFDIPFFFAKVGSDGSQRAFRE